LQPDPERSFKLLASLADTNHDGSSKAAAAATAAADDDDAAHVAADTGGGSGSSLPHATLQPQQQCMAEGKLEGPSHATISRLCKLHVEVDRIQAVREAGGHVCALYAMLHAQAMAKKELLVGVPLDLAASLPQALRRELEMAGCFNV
jgi:hypothetical protein